MSRLPVGVPNRHIQESHGADHYLMKFYVSQNSSTHNWDKFKPRPGRHTGSGFVSNVRPVMQYTARLDDIDNPAMGRIVAGNYRSTTKKHYLPHEYPTGGEMLPFKIGHFESGFSYPTNGVTHPTVREASSVHHDTRHPGPQHLLPRHRALLHQLKDKDPIARENAGHGPRYMASETHTRFVGEPLPQHDLYHKNIGPEADTGYTHANFEPVGNNPPSAHKNELPGYMTTRPTGVSDYTVSYRPYRFLSPNDKMPSIEAQATMESGFTRAPLPMPSGLKAFTSADQKPQRDLTRLQREQPAEFINMNNPHNKTSIHQECFKGQQFGDPNQAQRLNRQAVGWQEPTGFTSNSDAYVMTRDDPSRFITNYKVKFTDPTPFAKAREGHCRGGVLDPKDDSYVRSTAVHSLGPVLDTTATIRRMDPYQGRSLKARDHFYDDHTHDHKTLSKRAAQMSA